MNSFADELQVNVLSCLGVFERFKLSSVSKRWRKLIKWEIPVAVDLGDDNFWNLSLLGWQTIGHLVRKIERFPPEGVLRLELAIIALGISSVELGANVIPTKLELKLCTTSLFGALKL